MDATSSPLIRLRGEDRLGVLCLRVLFFFFIAHLSTSQVKIIVIESRFRFYWTNYMFLPNNVLTGQSCCWVFKETTFLQLWHCFYSIEMSLIYPHEKEQSHFTLCFQLWGQEELVHNTSCRQLWNRNKPSRIACTAPWNHSTCLILFGKLGAVYVPHPISRWTNSHLDREDSGKGPSGVKSEPWTAHQFSNHFWTANSSGAAAFQTPLHKQSPMFVHFSIMDLMAEFENLLFWSVKFLPFGFRLLLLLLLQDNFPFSKQ